jgi:hypothetical protein
MFAEDPPYCIHDIAFAAAVGAHYDDLNPWIVIFFIFILFVNRSRVLDLCKGKNTIESMEGEN